MLITTSLVGQPLPHLAQLGPVAVRVAHEAGELLEIVTRLLGVSGRFGRQGCPGGRPSQPREARRSGESCSGRAEGPRDVGIGQPRPGARLFPAWRAQALLSRVYSRFCRLGPPRLIAQGTRPATASGWRGVVLNARS